MTPLVSLLHLCDSLFPIGGFAHSDGLEAATTRGDVRTAEDLQRWMEAILHENLAESEGPAVSAAWRLFGQRDWARLQALDAELFAIRPAAAARQSTRAMGTRLLKTWQQIHPTSAACELCGDNGFAQLTLPVAFGVVSQSAAIDEQSSLEGFCYVRLAATASCAMRLMAIGQHEAHTTLAHVLGDVHAVAADVIAHPRQPGAFMPVLDLAAMRHQYVHSRLFRS